MRQFWQVVALCVAVFFVAPAARATDLDKMSTDEIRALQQRLVDGGCYQGAIDGRSSKALQEAINGCPSQDPMLRIETGMHVAVINRIDVDRACRVAATGSDDKTVRIWSLPEGRLLNTLRVPISPGNGGKIYAVAISPDGRWVAAGGWGDASGVVYLYVFDALTGTMIARVGPFGDSIDHLAFSADGRWLAAVSGTGAGLDVVDAQTWKIVFRDANYAGDSYGAVFAPDSRLYTVANDGKLRLYGLGGDHKEVATQGGKRPFSVAVDPSGRLVAVGFDDSTKVDVYDAATLQFRFAADTTGVDNGDLSKVGWSSDGTRLFAAGRYYDRSDPDQKNPLLTFGRDGQRIGKPLPLSDNTIMDLKRCGNGIVVAAADPAFGVVDANGRIALWITGVAPDMRDKREESFTIAPDARQVRFGLAIGGEEPVLFNLEQATVRSSPDPVPGLQAPLVKGLQVSDWKNDINPTFDGKPIELIPFERSRSLAIRRDHTGFVLSTNYRLRAFDADGKEIWGQPVPGTAWGVNISSDGQIIVAAYGDGTIRWHRWKDGTELLAFFVNRKTKTWIAWTPLGYYMASPGGEDLIGWHLNRGWNQAADFFPASKFRDKFARSDIVELVLETLDEGEAIRRADRARPQRAAVQAPIIESLPPVLSILSPFENAQVDTANVRIDYLVRSPSGTPIDGVEALINGAPAGARSSGDDSGVKQCIAETHGLGRTVGASQGCPGSLTIALPPGTTLIGVSARAGSKSSELAEVLVARKGPPTQAETGTKPKLYALVVGISKYADPAYKLEFAAKDAHDFASSLAHQTGSPANALYSDFVPRLLVDEQATAVAIKDGLDWLSTNVTDRDVGIIYLAGHGLVDAGNRFYFLAADSDPKRLKATAVAQDDIAATLAELAGKALLFLDACHAGMVVNNKGRSPFNNNEVINDFQKAHGSERSVIVFAASTGRQLSMENPTWGNGAFTKALVEGLGSPGAPALAKFPGDDTITPAILEAYVERRVDRLTNSEQTPVMTSNAPAFPLAIAK